MHKLLPVVLAAVLLPTAAAAQKVPPVGARIAEAQAKSVAVERVRGDLAAGKLAAWGDPHVAIARGSVAASRTLFNPTGGKDGGGIYVVLVSAAQAKGQVRVIVDATNGAVLSSVHRDFGSVAPDWWVKGLNAPPSGNR